MLDRHKRESISSKYGNQSTKIFSCSSKRREYNRRGKLFAPDPAHTLTPAARTRKRVKASLIRLPPAIKNTNTAKQLNIFPSFMSFLSVFIMCFLKNYASQRILKLFVHILYPCHRKCVRRQE